MTSRFFLELLAFGNDEMLSDLSDGDSVYDKDYAKAYEKAYYRQRRGGVVKICQPLVTCE